MTAGEGSARLSTPTKLLLVLTAALLPIGFALVWMAYEGIHDANAALQEQSATQASAAAHAIESLVARDALALRIAANGRIGARRDGTHHIAPGAGNIGGCLERARRPVQNHAPGLWLDGYVGGRVDGYRGHCRSRYTTANNRCHGILAGIGGIGVGDGGVLIGGRKSIRPGPRIRCARNG